MAAEHRVRVSVGAHEVHRFLREGLSHIELISEDVFGSAIDDNFVAVMLYEQFFMRVGNQAALMVIVAGDTQAATVKVVACAASENMFFGWDMGAAGDFSAEPLRLLQERYGARVEVLDVR